MKMNRILLLLLICLTNLSLSANPQHIIGEDFSDSEYEFTLNPDYGNYSDQFEQSTGLEIQLAKAYEWSFSLTTSLGPSIQLYNYHYSTTCVEKFYRNKSDTFLEFRRLLI